MQKPVELYAIPMQYHTSEGDICCEPFAGSGSQFIAAEQLNRRCFGLELSAQYCDVIVARWEKLTGRKATLDKPVTPKKRQRQKAAS
jgi:DNA modification methylase